MMICTDICELLKITHPIVQAGMGGVAGPELAAAVSNAGAMGCIGAYRSSPSEIRDAVRKARILSALPIGVNFVPDVLSKEEIRLGVSIAIEEGVRIFSFFSSISADLIKYLHEYDALVLVQVGSVEQASMAISDGVDVLIVQGWEAGGHLRGQTSLLPLLSAISHRWPHFPSLASGGIVTGRNLAAVLAAGASGAWMGTRFVATMEADAHPEYQKRLISATSEDTVVTHAFERGWPGVAHRVLRNSVTSSTSPLAPRIISSVQLENRRIPITIGSVAVPMQSTIGEIEAMAQYSGQGCELIDAVEPAAIVINKIIEEAAHIIYLLSRSLKNSNNLPETLGNLS
jgi:nitronate monooxygenase